MPRRRRARRWANGRPSTVLALEPEHPAERLVDEGQAALGVAPQDDVGLVVQQIAVARLVLADLPLDVLELLQPPLEALADAHEAVELGGQDRAGAERGAPNASDAGVLAAAERLQRLQPGAQPARQVVQLGHA